MPRQTYPRPDHHHAMTASSVLARHSSTVGTPVDLPVPIELIIEQTYRLEILWEDVPEPSDTVILGALAPSDRRIVLNMRHQALFEQYMGPERFTLAHELGHWIYDADDPDQLALDLDGHSPESYCYYRESPGLPEILRIRELNANKFAAHLLLPEDLVRRANFDEVLKDLPGTARRWQVSRTTLRIRLQDLGIIREHSIGQMELMSGYLRK